jgi:signal transduction histidine kinase
MFRSLRWRIALSHSAVLLVTLLALGVGLRFVLAARLDATATRALQEAAAGVVEHIREEGSPVPPPDADAPSDAGVRIAVFALPSGDVVGEPTEVPTWLRAYPAGLTDLGVSGEPVRVVVVTASIDGRAVAQVAAGRSLAPEQAVLHQIDLLLLAGGALAVLASLAAGWFLAGRAVRPVERAYEAQAGFAADASHELRTPLAFVRQGVEVLARHDPELGGEVLGEVDHLTHLTQRLLSLARVDRGALELRREVFEVREVVVASVRRSERVHGSTLDASGTRPAKVVGDPVLLAAALDAVLENVARHGHGAATIADRRDARRVSIVIADHGPGLTAEGRAHAFDRFYRADTSRTRATGGAGLGLALARSLVEAQGGRIRLEETPGGGLTVVIDLSGGPASATSPTLRPPRAAEVSG